jgi:Tol biopolymer transport system component
VLRVYTVSTGQTRSVWDSRTWETAALGAQLAWSPDGRWIALAAQPSSSNSLRWLGLIAPDGSNTLRLDTPQRAAGSRSGVNDLQGRQSVPGGTITALAFSNDGRYLALSGSFGQPQLLIYDVADRRIARTISGIESPQLQWSPDDRQLLLSGQGVAVLNSPLDPNSQIEPLTEGENCSFASWKPK